MADDLTTCIIEQQYVKLKMKENDGKVPSDSGIRVTQLVHPFNAALSALGFGPSTKECKAMQSA